MIFFKRYIVLSLLFVNSFLSYPISVHVLRSPQGRPIVLLGDVHLETEGLLDCEEEVLGFIKEAIESDIPLDLIWEKTSAEVEEYKGIMSSLGKRTTGGEIISSVSGSGVQETVGIRELGNCVVEKLKKVTAHNVVFYPADPREGYSHTASQSFLIEQFVQECKQVEKQIRRYRGHSFSDVHFRCLYNVWKNHIQKELAKRDKLLDAKNELADYSLLYQVLHTNNPVLVYAGYTHTCVLVAALVRYYGFTVVESLLEGVRSEEPVGGGIIKRVLEQYIMPHGWPTMPPLEGSLYWAITNAQACEVEKVIDYYRRLSLFFEFPGVFPKPEQIEVLSIVDLSMVAISYPQCPVPLRPWALDYHQKPVPAFCLLL
jgi:hypothetical protein